MISSNPINDAELDALRGLPPLTQVLYLLAIRPRADPQTMLVSGFQGFLWNAFQEDLAVWSQPGIQGWKPTTKQLFAAFAKLEKRGLIAHTQGTSSLNIVIHLLLSEGNNK